MHDRARCGGWVVCVGKKEIHCQMLNNYRYVLMYNSYMTLLYKACVYCINCSCILLGTITYLAT